ncbi:MAG: metallopeptidase family protein [Planctomycetota bacterium]
MRDRVAAAAAGAAAWSAYLRGDATRAREEAIRATRLDPDTGEYWYTLGCIRDMLQDEVGADRAFARAAAARRHACPAPCRIDADRFAALAREALTGLPPALQPAVRDVDLIVMDHPTPDLIDQDGTEELLGLFVGHPLGDGIAWGEPELSPRLYLFRRAHEHACSDPAAIRHELRITAIHELGHYLGLDEDDLADMGLA